MTVAVRLFAALSSVLAAFVTLFFLYETQGIPFVLLFFCALAAVQIVLLSQWFTLPQSAANTVYFSSVTLQLTAIFVGAVSFVSFVFITILAHRAAQFSPILAVIAANILAAPAGLFAILWLNRRSSPPASFFKGSFVAVPLALLLYAPEYAWIKYHEQRLATARAEEVISSLHSLANIPSGDRRFTIAVCKNLVLRDISDPYFMYNDNDTTFRSDHGLGKIVEGLNTRFGDDAYKVIDQVKVAFGQQILGSCTDWKNPTSG